MTFSSSGTGSTFHGTGTFDGANQASDFIYADSTGRASGPQSGYFVNALNSSSTVVTRANAVSLDVDGCTLNWSNVTIQPWMILRFYR